MGGMKIAIAFLALCNFAVAQTGEPKTVSTVKMPLKASVVWKYMSQFCETELSKSRGTTFISCSGSGLGGKRVVKYKPDATKPEPPAKFKDIESSEEIIAFDDAKMEMTVKVTSKLSSEPSYMKTKLTAVDAGNTENTVSAYFEWDDKMLQEFIDGSGSLFSTFGSWFPETSLATVKKGLISMAADEGQKMADEITKWIKENAKDEL
mmetsp:Transcript_20816/g.44368  ORF Transcript_20816/g.44368 Transcript_20816/m.44368 type:complete len:207 (+) Transcript_20816:94-714(+)